MKESLRFYSQQGDMDDFGEVNMENYERYKYKCPYCGWCDSIKHRPQPEGHYYRIWSEDPPKREGVISYTLERKCANSKCRGNPEAPPDKRQIYYVEFYTNLLTTTGTYPIQPHLRLPRFLNKR